MQIRKWKSGNFLVFLLTAQFITCITVVLDIPVVRQVIGFLYLSLIPGMIILRVLKLQNLGLTETILLSLGLSIAFLMLIGVLINELFPLIGVSKPLLLVPLMTVINTAIFLLGLLSCHINREGFNIAFTEVSKSSLIIVLFALLPLLSVVGAMFVNAFNSSLILLLMITTISALVILSILSEKLVPSRYYPLALLLIAIALLLHTSLISNYIHGRDTHLEFYLFRLTQNNSYWNPAIRHPFLEYNSMNAMLSVTVFPTIYSVILNISATWMVKIIYPLILSCLPLGLYRLYHISGFGKKAAFLATFFFIANETFFTEILGNTRQIVAELFYVLLFLVLFSRRMNPLSKKICFIFFSFALVVSHYTTSYIFMFLIFFTWLSSSFLKRKHIVSKTGITAGLVALCGTVLFSWYIYVSVSGPFNYFVSMTHDVTRNILTQFLNPESRGRDILRALGMETAPSFWHLIGRIFFYTTEFFILVGFVASIIRRREIFKDQKYVVLSSLNVVILIMCIVLPNFARSFNMTRFYHMTLLFLAPLFILGVKAFFEFIAKLRNESYILGLILIILIPFFLFQTELVYEVAGDSSYSIPLSMYRMDLIVLRRRGLTDERDVFGAKWVSENIDVRRAQVYADVYSKYMVLTSYGVIDRYRIDVLSNTTRLLRNTAVYLSPMNVIKGTIIGIEASWNITESSFSLDNMNKIYSNGGCEIYSGSEI